MSRIFLVKCPSVNHIWLHDLCLQAQIVHGNELHLFSSQGIDCEPDIAALDTNLFYVFRYGRGVWPKLEQLTDALQVSPQSKLKHICLSFNMKIDL